VNLRTYKPLDHQHIPEITQTLGDAGAKNVIIRFVPVSAPLSRGIFATCFAHIPESTTADEVRALYKDMYKREPFVRVPEKRLPEVAAVSGTNYAEIGIQVGSDGAEPGKRVVACFAATDNLIKGGAGQAIQSMNIMLGVDERTSLEDPGGWP
jgi:N-acetyl-gamma-glutamyl-phosphate reductase